MEPITVLLADDHQIVREGFRSLLKLDAMIVIVGEAHDGREAVALAQKLRPAVVVMDIAMPLLNGLGATQQILAALPQTKIIVLSAHSDDAYIGRALAVGVSGYLIKQTSAQILARAIREVHAGNGFFSPSIAKRVEGQNSAGKAGTEKKFVATLTARELEVIQLIAEGQGNKQVAADLDISIKTVEKHRQHVMDKLKIHDTASLTRYAIAHGLVESSIQNTTGQGGSGK